MTKETLRIGFADFWPRFDETNNWFLDVLRPRFDVQVVADPEVLIYSCYGKSHLRYRCTRVFVSWENRPWGFSSCDWAFTSDYNQDKRHHRLPLWVMLLDQPFVQSPLAPREVLAEKTGFAAVVVSNRSGRTRERVHDLLDGYQTLSSGGRHRNNVGGPVADKLEFIRQFKFSLAFENSSHPGYTTEKLLQSLQAMTVPLYWGDPEVGRDFNTRRFVNYHDFESDSAFLRRVVELDTDDDAYCEVLAEPWFNAGRVPSCADLDAVRDRFELIRVSTTRPVAQRRKRPTVAARSVADRWEARRRFRSRVF